MRGNVTTVNLTGSKYIDAPPLWRYDYGQKIRFIGNVPDRYVIDLASDISGTACNRDPDGEDCVTIPDELLSGCSKKLLAYVFEIDERDGTRYGRTVARITIPVVDRPPVPKN